MVHVNVGANLQVLSDVLNHHDVWAFSLADNESTHQGVSLFDVHIRVYVGGRLFNIHLVVVPFYDRHSAVNICKMICKLLDQLCSSWQHKLLSVSTDGENTMTGWKGGFVTLMDKESANEVLRVWCPAHQMDLVIQDATIMINDDAFTKTTHSFTLLEWIEQRQHASSPIVEYLIIACTINPLAKAYNVTLVNLQQRNLCLSQQTEYIEQLVQNILLMVDIQNEDDNEAMQRGDREKNSYLELGVWWVTFKDVFVHVKDQGTWVKDLFLLRTHED
ncbi:unnamed protein product [Sphagnum balticum]